MGLGEIGILEPRFLRCYQFRPRIRILLRVFKFSVVVSLIYLLVFSSNSVVKILATVSASYVMGCIRNLKKIILI